MLFIKAALYRRFELVIVTIRDNTIGRVHPGVATGPSHLNQASDQVQLGGGAPTQFHTFFGVRDGDVWGLLCLFILIDYRSMFLCTLLVIVLFVFVLFNNCTYVPRDYCRKMSIC